MCKIRDWLKTNQDLATTISDALTALGVVAGAIMFIWQWHSSNQAKLNVTLVNSTPFTVSVLITNSGGVDAAVKRISVKSGGINANDFLDIKSGGKLLEKGKSTLETFDKSLLGIAVQKDYLDKPGQTQNQSVGTTDCAILIEMIDADGKIHSKEVKFECIAGCVAPPKTANKEGHKASAQR